MKKWILNDAHELIEVGLFEWAQWFEDIANRRVDSTRIDGDTWLSTVFLGVDQGIGNGSPLIFETILYRRREYPLELPFHSDITFNWEAVDTWHYATWDEAVEGHERAYKAEMGVPLE